MFDIGWSEIVVVVIITILVVGPKELPGLLRTVGKTVGNVRRMAGDFQNQFNQALREAELDGVADTISDVRSLNPRTAVKNAVTKQLGDLSEVDEVSKSLKESTDEINSSLNDKSDSAATADTEASAASSEPVVVEEAFAVEPKENSILDDDGSSDTAPKNEASEKADR